MMASTTEERCTDSTTEQPESAPSNDCSVANAEPSVLEKKIIRQVEFYFGDRNLPRDKFLQEKIKEDDGWVLLDVLLTFNRLKSLSTDPTFIVAALRKSSEGVVEVSEDGRKVRRCPSLPSPSIGLLSPDQRKELRDRTLHLKGFPEDSTLDEIQDLLEQYGQTALIQMRRMRPSEENTRGNFKGSVLVEFKSKESAEQLMKEEEIKFRGSHVLQAEYKDDWLARKTSEKKQTKQEKKLVQQEKEEKQLAADATKVMKEACLLHFKGVATGTTREQIKEYFRQFATVAWIEFSIGEEQGTVRFEEEGGAKKALESIQLDDGGCVQLCGGLCKLRLLEGEEERLFWERKLEQERKKRRTPSGGQRGRRGWSRGNKRPASSGEEPSAKQAKQ